MIRPHFRRQLGNENPCNPMTQESLLLQEHCHFHIRRMQMAMCVVYTATITTWKSY